MRGLFRGLDPLGTALCTVMLALSLTPSLLPRLALVQGIGSGLVFGIGYAGGTGLSTLLGRWVHWRPPMRVRRAFRLACWAAFTVVMVAGIVAGSPSEEASGAPAAGRP